MVNIPYPRPKGPVHYLWYPEDFVCESYHVIYGEYIGTTDIDKVTCDTCSVMLLIRKFKEQKPMIQVIEERDGTFTVNLGAAELNVLRKVALGYSMPLTDALASCLSKGFDERATTLAEIASYEARQRAKKGSEDKTT